MSGSRLRALVALLVVSVGAVSIGACGTDRATESGGSDTNAAGAPEALPEAPGAATTLAPGTTMPKTGSTHPPTSAVHPSNGGALPARPAAPSVPAKANTPAAPAPAPPTSERPPLSPELVVWCPVAAQAWLLLSNVTSLQPEDVPKAIEVVGRTRDLAPPEVRPQMDRLMDLTTLIKKGLDEGKIRLTEPGGATAYIDDQLGAGATARYTDDIKAVAEYGFNHC